jgi:hypothetical protein
MARTTLRSSGQPFTLIAYFTDEVGGQFVTWYEVLVNGRIVAVEHEEIYD